MNEFRLYGHRSNERQSHNYQHLIFFAELRQNELSSGRATGVRSFHRHRGRNDMLGEGRVHRNRQVDHLPKGLTMYVDLDA